MKYEHIGAILVLTLLLGTTVVQASSVEQEPPQGEGSEELELWDDPTFQKQFTASYGVNAEIEPRVTAVEREQMEKVRPLMAADLEVAANALAKYTKPESSAVFDFTLGNIYFQQEDFETAVFHYEAALAKFPSFRRAHKNLGIIYVRDGRYEEAIRSLSRVVELGGGDGLTFGLLGYAYSATGQHLSAESAYRRAVLLQPDTKDWKLGLTQAVYKQQKFAEAITLIEELIAADPEQASLWLMQANAYIGLDQPMKAAYNFEIVQRLGKAKAPTLFMLGDIYVNEGLWELAGRSYMLAFEADPEQDLGRPRRSIEVLAQRGALEQAKQLLASADQVFGERLAGDERKDLLKLEARIAVSEGEGGDAVEVLEEIIELDPLDGDALILLGQHYAGADDPERAIFYFERAESLGDFEADARVHHAQVLVAQSRYNEAVPLLKRAQEIEPRDEVADYLEQVERVARARR